MVQVYLQLHQFSICHPTVGVLLKYCTPSNIACKSGSHLDGSLVHGGVAGDVVEVLLVEQLLAVDAAHQ